MKITISGTLGSGKSTVGKMLAEKLEYEYYYTGDIARRTAQEKGMTLLEFNRLREKEPRFNIELDNIQKNIGLTKNNFIVDGHLGYYFIPDSIKIFLKCKPSIAAERVLKSLREKNEQRKKEGLPDDETKTFDSLTQRYLSEIEQYKKVYDADFSDESNFDLIIDTSNIPAEEVCNKILAFLKRKQAKKGQKR